MKNYNTYAVEKLSDMKELVGTLDSAEYSPVYYGEDKKIAPSHIGIYNTRSEELAQISSRNYAIIQHNDVMLALEETLRNRNINISGRIDDFGDSVRFDLIFGSKTAPIKDDAKGINVGIRVTNSYDKSTSFRMEMFGFRMICQNGMSLGSALNNIKEVCFHTGTNKNIDFIKQMTSNFIDTVINSSNQLQNYVNESLKDSIGWKRVTNLLEKLLASKRHRSKILELLNISVIEVTDKKTGKVKFDYVLEKDGKKQISRWDLYNALTAYTSHNKIGITTETTIQDKAQKILKESSEELLKVEVETQ